MRILAALLIAALPACASVYAYSPLNGPTTGTESDTLVAVVYESDPAPAPLGGVIERIVSSSVNAADTVAFAATLSSSSARCAVFLASNGALRPILQSGQPAPGGGAYDAFLEVDVSQLARTVPSQQQEVVLFDATLTGTAASEGLFLWRGDTVELLALAGGTSPRGKTYARFSSITIGGGDPTNPAIYEYAFVAQMTDGSKSVVIAPTWDTISEVLSTGDLIGPNANQVVDDFAISQLGYSLGCVARVHKANKKRSFDKAIILHHGLLFTGNGLEVGARFKRLGRVTEIASSPGCHWQQAYLAVRFKSGESTIVQRDVDGSAEVYARASDPGVALPAGETLTDFGPPLANGLFSSNPGDNGFMMVSRVTLSSGRTALWARYLPYTQPLPPGTVKLMYVGGAASVGGEQVALRDFAPVKVTDLYSVLLTGTVGDGAQARRGLFLAPKVFIEPPQ